MCTQTLGPVNAASHGKRDCVDVMITEGPEVGRVTRADPNSARVSLKVETPLVVRPEGTKAAPEAEGPQSYSRWNCHPMLE